MACNAGSAVGRAQPVWIPRASTIGDPKRFLRLAEAGSCRGANHKRRDPRQAKVRRSRRAL
jgi:hypothetical protein